MAYSRSPELPLGRNELLKVTKITFWPPISSLQIFFFEESMIMFEQIRCYGLIFFFCGYFKDKPKTKILMIRIHDFFLMYILYKQ